MSVSQPEAGKKYFTLDEANRMLPLIRAIVQDITDLYAGLTERARRFEGLDLESSPDGRREELEAVRDEFERDEERLREFIEELHKLGVEFKGFDMGLVDFPSWKDGREIYLCWKMGEPTVAHWHEIHAGFAGRRSVDSR